MSRKPLEPTAASHSFLRLYACGPSEDLGKLNRALDDFLVDGDWPESLRWVLKAEPEDPVLTALYEDLAVPNDWR